MYILRPGVESGEVITENVLLSAKLCLGEEEGGVSLGSTAWSMVTLEVHIEVMVAEEGLAAVGACNILLGEVCDARDFVDEVRLGSLYLGKLGALQAEVLVADMVLQTDLGAELVTAALVVVPANQPCTGYVDLSADEAEALVGGSDVGIEVGLLCELLDAVRVWASNRLSILDSLPGVVHLDVLLKLPSSGGLELAEHTVLVFLADVSLEEHFCCKSYTLLRPIRHPF